MCAFHKHSSIIFSAILVQYSKFDKFEVNKFVASTQIY